MQQASEPDSTHKSCVVLINGFPGIGKLTIAKLLEVTFAPEHLCLVDNLSIVDLAQANYPNCSPENRDLRMQIRRAIYYEIKASHSGQFCPGHARNTLNEMVETAIKLKMHTFAVTEHMPRGQEDFYPEEREISTEQSLQDLIDGFYTHAMELREKFKDQINILIGFEAEWIRPSTVKLIKDLAAKHDFDYFIGSVHHVLTHPIDYDRASYETVRQLVGGTDEELFAEYFDAQYAMLKLLKPKLVGHFDLIRLYSDDPNESFKEKEGVWEKIERNLKFIAGYGGVLELNSSALRKGMGEPYPKVEICKEFLAMGGKFAFSDDSHGVEQVGLNYHRVLDAIKQAGIEEIVVFRRGSGEPGVQNGGTHPITLQTMSIAEVEALPFWNSLVTPEV